MLIDSLEMFHDGAVTADALATYAIDLLPNGGALNSGDTGGPTANTTINIAAGKPLYLYALVKTALTGSAGTSSLIVTLESDSTVALDSATTHWTSAEFEQATLVGGYWIAKGIPLPAGSYQRYLGLRFAVGAEENFTAGEITAWISDTPYSDEQYRSGITDGIN